MAGRENPSNPNPHWRPPRPPSRVASSPGGSGSVGQGPGGITPQGGSGSFGSLYSGSVPSGGSGVYPLGPNDVPRYPELGGQRNPSSHSSSYPTSFSPGSSQSLSSASRHNPNPYPLSLHPSPTSYPPPSASYGQLHPSLSQSGIQGGRRDPTSSSGAEPYGSGYSSSSGTFPLSTSQGMQHSSLGSYGRLSGHHPAPGRLNEPMPFLTDLSFPASSSTYDSGYIGSSSGISSSGMPQSMSVPSQSSMGTGASYTQQADSSHQWQSGYQGRAAAYPPLQRVPITESSSLRLDTNLRHHPRHSRGQSSGPMLSTRWPQSSAGSEGTAFSPMPSSASSSYLQIPGESSFIPTTPIDSRDTASPASSSSSSSVTFVPFHPGQATLLAHKITEDKSLSDDKLNELFPPSSQCQTPTPSSGKTQTGKKWICQWPNCRKAVRRQDRMAHALEHYGRKRFQCSCGHAFARTQDKRRHLREQATCKTCLRPVGRNGVDGVCSSCLAENAKKNSSPDNS